ncbi:hypothetical protein ANCCAN_29032, partial [Ancylostoma caninum]
MTLSLSIPEGTTTEERDPAYLPPNEVRQIQHRQQVIDALHSSQQEVERFWNIWQQQYLLSLRETHRKYVSNRRQGKEHPEIGDVVLISDPVQPRNEWKMGRITQVRYGADGEVREAELVTSTRRKIRRPINLLIPLEIQEARATEGIAPTDSALAAHEPPQENQKTHVVRTHPYNLRERKPTNYAQERVTATTVTASRLFSPKWFLFYVMILSLTKTTSGNSTFFMSLQCAEKGVFINATAPQDFEICADRTCKVQHSAGNPLLVKFPPEVTLNSYKVLLKWKANDHLAVLETRC